MRLALKLSFVVSASATVLAAGVSVEDFPPLENPGGPPDYVGVWTAEEKYGPASGAGVERVQVWGGGVPSARWYCPKCLLGNKSSELHQAQGTATPSFLCKDLQIPLRGT